MWAWYSEEQLRRGAGLHVYLTSDGREVTCTSVTRYKNSPPFPDVKSLGEVDKWVRNERNPIVAMKPAAGYGYGLLLAERRRREKKA
jgi:hypothetical protein